jgi:hypothetical protein
VGERLGKELINGNNKTLLVEFDKRIAVHCEKSNNNNK